MVFVGVLYLSMGLSSFGKTIPCPPQPLATPTRSVVSYPLNSNGTPRAGIRMHVDRERCKFHLLLHVHVYMYLYHVQFFFVLSLHVQVLYCILP